MFKRISVEKDRASLSQEHYEKAKIVAQGSNYNSPSPSDFFGGSSRGGGISKTRSAASLEKEPGPGFRTVFKDHDEGSRIRSKQA